MIYPEADARDTSAPREPGGSPADSACLRAPGLAITHPTSPGAAHLFGRLMSLEIFKVGHTPDKDYYFYRSDFAITFRPLTHSSVSAAVERSIASLARVKVLPC